MKKHIRLNRGYGARVNVASPAALWFGELNAILGEMFCAVVRAARLRASLRGPYAQLGAAPQARRGLVETDIT